MSQKIKIPPKANCRIIWEDAPENYTKDRVKRIEQYIAQKYSVEKVQVIFKPKKVDTEHGQVEMSIADNVMDTNYQRRLFKEWLDGNKDNEDRVGYFTTLEGEKIRKATSMDDYILGIISATPSVVGDNYESWQDKYVTDEFGRIQYHDVIIPATYETIDGKQIIIQEEHIDKHPIYNSNWDSSQEYISRENRPEWSPVGMMGKLLVRDDGTCEVGKWCKCNNNSIATISETRGFDTYMVLERINENVILIEFK